MEKNKIIEKIVDKLLSQRAYLNDELANLNYNEPTANDKKMTLEVAINNIDMQLDRRVMDCEIAQT